MLTAIALLAWLSAPQSAPESADTAAARQTMREVNESLARFTKASFEAKRPDVEYRSEVTAWSDAQGVRKLAVTDRDDSGDVVTEYYYASGSLVFVYQAIKGYNDAGKQVTRGEERSTFAMGRWWRGSAGCPTEPRMGRPPASSPRRRRFAWPPPRSM